MSRARHRAARTNRETRRPQNRHDPRDAGPVRYPVGDVEPEDLTQPAGGSTHADAPDTAEEHSATEPSEIPAEDASATRPPSVGQLRRERKRLWDERQETTYHVGGLAVEMRRREMLDDGLVARRADVVLDTEARIVAIDEQLAGIDDQRRRSRVRMPPPQGYCLSCGGPYLADAAFCSRCGARIHTPAADGDTEVIPVAEAGPSPAAGDTEVIPTVDERAQ